MSNIQQKPNAKVRHIKRFLAQSEYITVVWTWFMILAGKAAEPVLVASVLYASIKLLPIVHFPPQFDIVVFIAQFVALDIGGLSLNKLADQAKKDGNEEGAKQAKRLSIALVSVMLIGVILAGVDQMVTLNVQVGTGIDTILLITRAVMAVLYSRVIHRLQKDHEPDPPTEEHIKELITETVHTVLATALTTMQQEMVTLLEASLSQQLDTRLTMLDMKQTSAMGYVKDEQDTMIRETVTSLVETMLRKRSSVSLGARETKDVAVSSSKGRSMSESALRQQATGGEREIDKRIWPLLDRGLSVRSIAAQAHTSTATVGRSRQRWIVAAQDVSVSQPGTPVEPTTLSDDETEERAL